MAETSPVPIIASFVLSPVGRPQPNPFHPRSANRRQQPVITSPAKDFVKSQPVRRNDGLTIQAAPNGDSANERSQDSWRIQTGF